jgi:hypothetical protein
MLKRIVLLLALGAALVACSPSGSSTSTSGAGESAAPLPSASGLESTAPSMEASPSAS